MIQEQRISFSNRRGDTLAGIVHHPAGGRTSAAAILCHGMESDKGSQKIVALGRRLAETGIRALRFDFAYAGESSGKFEEMTYSGAVEDVRAAFDFMLGYGVFRIGVLGSSMGGTAALLFAAEEPKVASLVTVSAPLHPEKITDSLLSREQVRQWRESGFLIYHGQRINVSLLDDIQKINVPAAAKKVSCPCLILHGGADETVSVQEAYELYGHLQGPKKMRIFEGADHRLSDPGVLEAALEEAVDWTRDHLE